jgi:hypothetical protein
MKGPIASVPSAQRRVTLKVAYGAEDVEKAAESMDLQVSGDEVAAILANIDSELSALATKATHAAVLSMVFDELLIVCHAHVSGDDD